ITLRTENAGNDARLVVTSGTLVNDVGGTIEILGDAVNAGSRELRATIDNRGLIRHDYASQLTFFGQLTPTAHVNSGVIDIAAGGMRMRAGNALTNQVNGTISGSGTLHVLDGTFINEGKIAPGNSAGILSVSGSVTNTASSVLSIELGGLTVGTQYDRLAISGTIAIDGTLDVSFMNG